VATACGQSPSAPPAPTNAPASTSAGVPSNTATGASQTPEAGQTYTIETNTQAFINADLSIASGNFWEAAYTDANGAAQYGPTAALFISHRAPGTTEPDNTTIRVHAGQEITIGDYQIRVLEVRDSDSGASVTVIIRH
jgi:hypothetical protein